MLSSARSVCKNTSAAARARASCQVIGVRAPEAQRSLLTGRETEAQRGTGMSFSSNSKGVPEPGLEFSLVTKLSF